jgi:hypothetical protein
MYPKSGISDVTWENRSSMAVRVNQKNNSARNSMLRRGAASGGEVGSSNAVCAVRRAIPSPAES